MKTSISTGDAHRAVGLEIKQQLGNLSRLLYKYLYPWVKHLNTLH